MTGSRTFSIRYKLALLAGVPVIGALLLSSIIVGDARREAQSAAALGSIEDLALLSAETGHAVHQLELERAFLAMHLGEPAGSVHEAHFERTDASLRALKAFLSTRDTRKLPPRLARDLAAAQATLARLVEQRRASQRPDADPIKLLQFYGSANNSLISAVAALMQLSDDGKLLRTISSLVSVMQISETASQEHAVLADVFKRGEFAPGVYKVLVTLVSELAGSERTLRATAADDTQAAYDKAMRGDFAPRTAQMRTTALETMDDNFGIKAEDWFALQGEKVHALNRLEAQLNAQVKRIALDKIEVTRTHLMTSFVLAGAVLLTSIVLAWLIARGVTRSVSSLSSTAARVREDKDFTARAIRVSNDELGVLTEAFNEMLGGIQARDSELEAHRHNLEDLVAARTAELISRNDAMRIVLDNVEEGLARIHADGCLETETSAAFVRWFGAPAEECPLHVHFGAVDPDLELLFRLGWEAVTDDFLPWQLALEQMPRKLRVKDRRYELEYRPILHAGKLDGALLVATDVTEAFERARRAAEANERLHVFERVMQDRSGFIEFLKEADRLIEIMRDPGLLAVSELMRALHTLKGNCGIFGLHSIAAIAHELESFVVESERAPTAEAFMPLHAAWLAFRTYVNSLLGDDEGALELRREELESVIEHAEQRLPHEQLAFQLRELTYDSVQRRFDRMADRAKSLAQRLGKGEIAVEQEAGRLRLPAETWAPFWSAFVHVVRNAVDHGIESTEERRAAGKPPVGKIRFGARIEGGEYVIELADDGRGVDWQRMAVKAAEFGLPHASHEELVQAMFADGVTTREQSSDTSGRGIGMGAVRAACEALGGRLEVVSEAGFGTTFRFRVPLSAASASARKVA